MADYYEMLFLLLYLMLGLEFNLKCLSPVAAHLRAAGIHRWVNITDVSQTRGFAKNYNCKEPLKIQKEGSTLRTTSGIISSL